MAEAIGRNRDRTVGGPAKAKLAKAHGCDQVINYTQDFVKRAKVSKGALAFLWSMIRWKIDL